MVIPHSSLDEKRHNRLSSILAFRNEKGMMEGPSIARIYISAYGDEITIGFPIWNAIYHFRHWSDLLAFRADWDGNEGW